MRTRLPKKILIVDDDKGVADSLSLILSDAGFAITVADSFTASTSILKDKFFDLVITDLRLADDWPGNIRQFLRFPRPTLYRKLKKLAIKVERGVPPVAAKSRNV